jgi:phage terminase small subunit
MDEVGNRAEDFGLNEKQKRFCEYYMSNKSAGASYQRAYGIDENKELQMGSCYTNGSRLLKSDKINNYLNILRKDVKKRSVMEVDEIIGSLVEIATDVATKTSDKLRALELLGKTQALFQDRVQMDSTSTIEINLTGIESNPMKYIDHEPVKQIEQDNI